MPIKNRFFDPSSPGAKKKALLLITWLIIAFSLYVARSVLLPFLLSSLLAYVCYPAIKLLERVPIKKGPLPRALSVILVYLFVTFIFILIATFFIPQFYREMTRLAVDATEFVNSIDEAAINELGKKMEEFFRQYNLPLEIVAPAAGKANASSISHKGNLIAIDLLAISKQLLNDVITYIKSETRNIIMSANYIITKIASILFMLLLTLMITAFFLVDAERIKTFFFTLIPLKSRTTFDDLLTRVDTRLSGVVRGQLTICLVNAILTLIGLLILKIKFAFILATIAGIFSIVPIFGSIASTIPIVLIALTSSPIKALFALLWIVGIHALEANLLNPKIMGDSAKIHPILIILALLVGEHFYGIIGALLAVPIFSIIVTIFLSIISKAKDMDEGVANPL